MIFPVEAQINLQQLRQEWQEDAGLEYPTAVTTELLVLYDVCKALDLTLMQARAVLGEVGYQAVNEYINAPAVVSVNHEKVSALLTQMK